MIGTVFFLIAASAVVDAPAVLPDLMRPNATVAGIDVSVEKFGEDMQRMCRLADPCMKVQSQARDQFIAMYRTAKPKRRPALEAALADNTRSDGITDWSTIESILALTPRYPVHMPSGITCDTDISKNGRHIRTHCQ